VANSRVVRARTAREVEEIATQARRDLELAPSDRVSMTPLLEQVLYDLIDGYDFQVEEDRVMGDLDGLTDCTRPIIKIKNSVYHALQRGEGRARMTAAHEFGHLLMHCGMPTYHPSATKHDPLRDPERQANIFAAAFLMPRSEFVKCRTAQDARRKFGVSVDAAMCRARHLRHRFEATRPILTVNKKKGRKPMAHTP
jgi:Zn-dependent peptidase ImmA (M78 family)